MLEIETVKVKRDGKKGYHIINKSNFDPAIHELYGAETKVQNEHEKQAEDETKARKQAKNVRGGES